MIKMILTVFFSLWSIHIKANNLNQFETFIKEIENKNLSKGTVALISNNKVIYQRNFGQPDNTIKPIYRIGSISKTVTAFIILKLVEEKKLKLDDKLSLYFPQITNANKISVTQLLNHRSGLESYTSRPDYVEYFEKEQTKDQMIDRFNDLKLEFKPGSKFNYSNTGYYLLTLIAEKVSKKSYAELVNTYIAKPFELKNFYVYDAKNKRNPEEIDSYTFSNGTWNKSSNTHHTIPLGAGNIGANAEDLGKFFWNLKNKPILSEKLKKKMFELKDGYGFAITSFPYKTKKFLGHNGGIDDFSSLAGFSDSEDLVIVNLNNGSLIDTNDISINLLSSYYGEKLSQRDYPTFQTLPKENISKFIGNFSSEKNEFSFKIFEKNSQLYIQVPGQTELALEYYGQNSFGILKLGVKIIFNSSNDELDFSQGQSSLKLKKYNYFFGTNFIILPLSVAK